MKVPIKNHLAKSVSETYSKQAPGAIDDSSPSYVSLGLTGRRVGDKGDGAIVTTALPLKLFMIMGLVMIGSSVLFLYRKLRKKE